MDAAALRQLVLGALATRGVLTSAELQVLTGKSQPTVSRMLADLAPAVLTLGSARATRYGLGKSIHGRPSQHRVWWTDEQGHRQDVGMLTHLANGQIHLQSARLGEYVGSSLPWFLTPLRAEGFLGRLAGRAMQGLGIEEEPGRWDLETVLYAALQVHDAPGAITLGVRDGAAAGPVLPSVIGDASQVALDQCAAAIAHTLPAGSSAGGEQPKFLAHLEGSGPVIVKFSPPLLTPGGQRWADLLLAEHLASEMLADGKVPAAKTHFVRTNQRAYLVYERFDRTGAGGRRHVVSIGAVHSAFVQGTYRNWSETAAALEARRSLKAADADLVRTVAAFGRLIGNTDMHSGNLGLYVELAGVRRGAFALAPIYDMLPMRWRPDASRGGVDDYSPFTPDHHASGLATAMAEQFWTLLADDARASDALREVAQQMRRRVARAEDGTPPRHGMTSR